MTANTEASVIQQGILRLRDDLHNSRNLTVHHAVIEELNLLAEFARSAAATEAGTAITLRTTEMLKENIEKFIEDLKAKPRRIPVDDTLISIIEEKIHVTLEEASRLKGQMHQVVNEQPTDNVTAGLAKLRQGIAALSVISPEVNQTLSALLMNVEDYTKVKEEQFGTARENVEKWFDDAMDRVSGVFRRYSQVMALLIGVMIAFALNADSINLTLYLWRDPSVRQVLVTQTTLFELPQHDFRTNPEQAMEEFRDQFVGLELPIGWVINESVGVASADSKCQLFPGFNQAFGIPVPATNKCIAPPQSNNRTNLLLKLIGIFTTALVVSMVAPFCLDIWRRLRSLHGNDPNPAEQAGK